MRSAVTIDRNCSRVIVEVLHKATSATASGQSAQRISVVPAGMGVALAAPPVLTGASSMYTVRVAALVTVSNRH